jgi:hypothetical protein
VACCKVGNAVTIIEWYSFIIIKERGRKEKNKFLSQDVYLWEDSKG